MPGGFYMFMVKHTPNLTQEGIALLKPELNPELFF
ncbi:hypothetical protein SAMN05444144_101189 [Flavobacterium akiainvivens]|nr:hypothetical protein SAMN05444144_101189 [Flavobacterium akiainvivens]